MTWFLTTIKLFWRWNTRRPSLCADLQGGAGEIRPASGCWGDGLQAG